MEPLGADLRGMIAFTDEAVCAAVRGIAKADIARREPSHHPGFRIRVVEDPGALYEAMAEDMLRRIASAAEAGRDFVGLFPVGPVGQYRRLVEKVLATGARFDHCHLFFLDEYAHEDGRTVDKASPWSFERVARGHLLDHVWQAGLRPERVHFPGPDNIAHYDEMVLEASEGRGADVVYGGIGWSGHFAFWEPHLWEEFTARHGCLTPLPLSPSRDDCSGGAGNDNGHGIEKKTSEDAWCGAHSAFVRLHPMSILHNSLRAGGDWSSVLPCAYTVGPGLVLGAQWRSFWLDAYLGSEMSWQRFIGRLATHGPVTPRVPASYLQTMPGEVVFLGSVADDIGEPRVSWQ